MSRIKTAVAVLVIFFAGCAAERFFVVPPAHAGTSPVRWEYSCKEEGSDEKATDLANQMGAQGWELAGAASRAGWQIWCFKRPLP